MNIFTTVKYCCILHGRVCVMTLVLCSVVHLAILIVYTKFEDSSIHRCLADMMEKLKEGQHGQIKGILSSRWLILLYTIYLPYLTFVQSFKIRCQVVAEYF